MRAAVAQNLLLENVTYSYEETERGVWRRYVYPNGERFAEYRTNKMWGSLPLLHYTYGRCPETGRRITARGVVAVGRFAHGIIAIGQMSLGLIAIGQISFGVIFCAAQAAFGSMAMGQVAVGLIFGVGQIAIGQVAIGQLAYGGYVLAQVGWGTHVFDTRGIDPAAKAFFLRLIGQ
jgi:hypothetical protein